MSEVRDQHRFAWVAIGSLVMLLLLCGVSFAHDHNAPNAAWFNSLKSGHGICCSNNDGKVLSDVDWDSLGGHYRVRIDGKWIDVPDDAVVKEPNLAGPTMVWPLQYLGMTTIRCFMPGSMT